MVEPRAKITISTDDLVSVPQAAKELGVNFSTVYRWIRKGELVPFRIAKQVYITIDALNALKAKRSEILAK